MVTEPGRMAEIALKGYVEELTEENIERGIENDGAAFFQKVPGFLKALTKIAEEIVGVDEQNEIEFLYAVVRLEIAQNHADLQFPARQRPQTILKKTQHIFIGIDSLIFDLQVSPQDFLYDWHVENSGSSTNAQEPDGRGSQLRYKMLSQPVQHKLLLIR